MKLRWLWFVIPLTFLSSCSFAGKPKHAVPGNLTASDALTGQSRLQGAHKVSQNEMVFLSPLDHTNVTAVLDDHSAVDSDVPLTLENMPKMPDVE